MTNPRLKYGLRIAFPLLAIGALVLVVGWFWFGWGYIASNQDILNSLPEPPGVERIWEGSNPYRSGEMAVIPPDGWGTRATFRAPPEITREHVVRFYIKELTPAWEACVETDFIVGDERRNMMGNAIFGKGAALVSIDTKNMISGDKYDIYVDHDRSFKPTCHTEYPLPISP